MSGRQTINTNIRLNLANEDDRRAWAYLQNLDRKKYKSYSRAVVAALNDYFGRQERLADDPYLETWEKEVVYEIGLYIMDGFGPSQIARKLKERKILTPAAYYESKDIKCNVKKQGDPCGWDSSTIADMMDRWREYLGHTVNFKTRKESYKSKKTILNPESEWAIFENTHAPIWTEAMADAARIARQTRRRPTKMGEMGMFSGMMYCADCGSIMY